MFIDCLKKRGFLYQCTNLEKLNELMKNDKITAYVGFDTTAPSLHVGSLMQIMLIRLLIQYGHKVIVVLGGGTTTIGDPSGKDKMRPVLSEDQIAKNILGIKKIILNFIDNSNNIILLDNSEWLYKLNYLDFLNEFGRFFSINRMLSMDSVKSRLSRQQNMSFLEFNYMLLQAYDFYYLHKEYNCSLQIGGSDQWGNIIMGVDFIKRITTQEVFGMTTPLITNSSGLKMGKTEKGAIWLDDKMLSSYDYFQYWRNCKDEDIIKFARFYTELSDYEMDKFLDLVKLDINDAKKQLAYMLTKTCHGETSAKKSLSTAIKVFEKKEYDSNLPKLEIDSFFVFQGVLLYNLLYHLNLTKSKAEAKRLIKGKGVKINDQLVDDDQLMIDKNFISKDNMLKITLGKKRHILLSIKNK